MRTPLAPLLTQLVTSTLTRLNRCLATHSPLSLPDIYIAKAIIEASVIETPDPRAAITLYTYLTDPAAPIAVPETLTFEWLHIEKELTAFLQEHAIFTPYTLHRLTVDIATPVLNHPPDHPLALLLPELTRTLSVLALPPDVCSAWLVRLLTDVAP